jgi:hypothetical protein
MVLAGSVEEFAQLSSLNHLVFMDFLESPETLASLLAFNGERVYLSLEILDLVLALFDLEILLHELLLFRLVPLLLLP